MNIQIISVVDPETGLFTGETFSSTGEVPVEAIVPAGKQFVRGKHDPLCKRFDKVSKRVVDYQPPQPSEDHEWNAADKRWYKRADVLARESEAEAAVAAITRLEQGSLRAVREALLELLPANSPAKERLIEVDTQIAEERPALKRGK